MATLLEKSEDEPFIEENKKPLFMTLQIIQTVLLFFILSCFVMLTVIGWKAYEQIMKININFPNDELFCFIVDLFGKACSGEFD